MDNNFNDFRKFAVSSGIGSGLLDSYSKHGIQAAYINPTILEERVLNVSQMDVFSRLMMDRQIFLGTPINDDVANIIAAQLLWLESQDPGKDVQLLVNSPGGSVSAGYAIVDTMDLIQNDVSTTVIGMAASMGAVIASNGVHGKRYILPHARFMIHQPLGGVNGQASDIEIEANEIIKIKKELYKTLEGNSKLSYDEIVKKADRNCWLTAGEAVEYGFADSIINRNK